MKRIYIFLWIILFSFCYSQNTLGKNNEFRVLQLNVWMEGSRINNGMEAVADVILCTNPDLVTLSEVSTGFMDSLMTLLRKKSAKFYCIPTNDCGILTKYPIIEQQFVYSPDMGFNGVLKTSIAFQNKKLCLYSAHLDYQHYGAYLPRGYDGQSWKKMSAPVTIPDDILSFNNKSKRKEQIRALINDAAKESGQGSIILIGGDFNEPSCLDWGKTTKDLFDHKGTIIPWPCTLMLQKAGFIDTYRKLYPNTATHPGFTWPSDNPLVETNQLSWAPEMDERDRIDFIFYHKNQGIKLKYVTIVGPVGTILRGARNYNHTGDPVITPTTPWPTDHKGLLAIFSLKQ